MTRVIYKVRKFAKSRDKLINPSVNLFIRVVWCSYNELTNCLHVYRCLLTNRLHGKAAELCLANS